MDKKILLVEDEPFIVETYTHELEKSGYTVDVAEDGQKGLDLILNNQYDLILLDIMLPEIHGVDLLQKIKDLPDKKNTPVIMLTNLGQESVIEKSFNVGAAGYVLKINALPTQLVEKVKNFFESGHIDY